MNGLRSPQHLATQKHAPLHTPTLHSLERAQRTKTPTTPTHLCAQRPLQVQQLSPESTQISIQLPKRILCRRRPCSNLRLPAPRRVQLPRQPRNFRVPGFQRRLHRGQPGPHGVEIAIQLPGSFLGGCGLGGDCVLLFACAVQLAAESGHLALTSTERGLGLCAKLAACVHLQEVRCGPLLARCGKQGRRGAAGVSESFRTTTPNRGHSKMLMQQESRERIT